jgi:hypothetical protein
MNPAIEIALALFVMFAVISALRGNWAAAFGGVAAAPVLGLLAAMSGNEERRDDYWRRDS